MPFLFHIIFETREALFKTSFRFCYTPRKNATGVCVCVCGGGGGGGEGAILELPCPRVRLFMYLSAGFVQKISSGQFDLLYPNLKWWCNVLSRYVVHKNWDAIFKVKVTIRAYIITI